LLPFVVFKYHHLLVMILTSLVVNVILIYEIQ
jgi:hypothetical protein